MITRQQALKDGFIIDSTCYPNIAYRGPRFQPSEFHKVPTAHEESLSHMVCRVSEHYGVGKGNTHVLATEKGCKCDDSGRCPICDHGLGLCIICGAAEIELDKRTCEEHGLLKDD